MTALIMHHLKEPFFDELRTKQQLGYVVFSRATATRDVTGIQLMVQSPKHSTEYLHNAINEFLMAFRKTIKDISDEEFQVTKQAVLTLLSVKDINLHEE